LSAGGIELGDATGQVRLDLACVLVGEYLDGSCFEGVNLE
jgi:hypothetical protein